MQREWREAIDMRSSTIAIAVVLLSASLLRMWHLRAGPVTFVERAILDGAAQIIHTGSYRPSMLTRPTLPIYVQAGVAIVNFLSGSTVGAWRSLAAFNQAEMLGWARLCSAILGTATVAIVYQIGMRWGSRHALLGAGVLAVTPMHVMASREASDGALLALFTTLTLLLSISATERKQRGTFVRAGIASGLAAASHFAGALTIMLPITAAWMTVPAEISRTRLMLSAVAAGLLSFVVTTPLVVRDLPAFLNGFGDAASPIFGAGGPVDLVGQVLGTLQWPGLLLAISGLILGIARAITGPGHTRWTLLIGFPVVYFVAVAWHGGSSETVLLPILPAVVLLASIAVVSGVSQLRRFEIPRAIRTGLIATLTVLAVLPPAVASIVLVRQASAHRADGAVPLTDRSHTGR